VRSVSASIEEYDFSHAVLGFYAFFWSELCDWYLEIVKPRLYDGDEDAAANLLFVLDRVLRLAHPVMPFVTEEIWSYLPAREGLLIAAEYPAGNRSLVDTATALRVESSIETVRRVRRWRDLAGVPAGAVLSARLDGEPEFVGRLARLAPADTGEPALATIAGIEILAGAEIDADQVEHRIEAERSRLGSEIERLERKLGNEGFVAKAPPEVVAGERTKLDRYRADLAELG
jgi:valyl-tRNA synthetase